MKKQRNTVQKKIIMQALGEADHPTATELYEAVHATNEHISKATVFRVLSQYADNGEVLRLHIRNTDERYDTTLVPHAHMRCLHCGKIIDIVSPEIEKILTSDNLGGYRIFFGEVNFSGICGECDEKNCTKVN